jgi:hypothetical protein
MVMNLNQYIKTHWQSDEKAAADLGVSLRTIKNWKSVNPSGILKHTGQIIQRVNAFELLEFFKAIEQSIEQMDDSRVK